MPSLAAQAAGIRSLFLKPSSKLSTSGKAVGCKVRLRLVLSYCPLPPLRKCAPLRFRAAGAALHLLCAHILRGRAGNARLHPPFLRCRSGIADADSQSGIAPCPTPLHVMSGLDAPCRRFLTSPTARSRPDLPRLRLACSRPWQTVCHVSRRATQTAPAAEPMKEYAQLHCHSFGVIIHSDIQSGTCSYTGHSVKIFDGMADFQ